MSTPIRSIRKKCIDCAGGSSKEVKYCTVTMCELWPFRLGVLPRTAKKKYGELMDPEKLPAPGVSLEELS